MYRFLLLADCQLGAYATFSGMDQSDIAAFARRGMKVEMVPRTEGFAWDAERYKRSVQVANHLRPAFVVVAGDMVDDIEDEAQVEELFRITAELDSDIPIRWVAGNHDAAFDAAVPTPESLTRYREVFGDDSYVFAQRDTTYVVINTVIVGHPELVEEEARDQLAFLERALSAAVDAGQRVVLLGHHPLFVRHPEEPDTYWNIAKRHREPLLTLIRRHAVPLGFAGHWHRNAIAFDGDFEMVTSGPVGYPLGDDPSGYRIVDVGDDITHEYHPLPTADERPQ